MLGAIIGDVVGSRFEWNNHRSKDFELFSGECKTTDDSIMTLAIGKAILECKGNWEWLSDQAIIQMQLLGRQHPFCGFGKRFKRWVFSDNPSPYQSYGNGAAMRVSPCGFAGSTEEEVLLLSRLVTQVTHNHAEGIKGAQAVALAIFLVRKGATLPEIKERIEKDFYPLDFTIDSIRETYQFNSSCQGTVPQAITAFLESTSFEDAIRIAISLGGDSDTVAAITGSIAEAYYGIPRTIAKQVMPYLDEEMRETLRTWQKANPNEHQKQHFNLLTKYIGKLNSRDHQAVFQREALPFLKDNHFQLLLENDHILNKHGLSWNTESMQGASAENMEEEGVLSLLVGVLRANAYADGVLQEFAEAGCLDNWLMRLQSFDEQQSSIPEVPAITAMTMRLRQAAGNERHILQLDQQGFSLIQEGAKGLVEIRIKGGDASEHCLTCLQLLEKCLSSPGWKEHDPENAKELVCYFYDLEAQNEEGETISRKGVFDRVHIPEQPFKDMMESLHNLLDLYGILLFESIMSLPGFTVPLKSGEVKICGVAYNDGGKIYHYRTDILSIKPGDQVLVPVGYDNREVTAIVKTVENYRWDNPPYPLEKIKPILGILGIKPVGLSSYNHKMHLN